jgi:hypothetical protein
MPDEPVIAFDCPACGKSYRVAKALAGRSAKCKQCGEKMQVPEFVAKPSVPEDDGFIPLVDDGDDKPESKSKPIKPLTFGDEKKPAKKKSGKTRPAATKPTPKNPAAKKPSSKAMPPSLPGVASDDPWGDDDDDDATGDSPMSFDDDAPAPSASAVEPAVESPVSDDPWEDDDEEAAVAGSADASTADDAWTAEGEFSISDLESLAAPEGEEELEPTVFATQATYTAPSKTPRNKAAKVGNGLLKNIGAMWDALVNPSKAQGVIPLTRRISMGGSFLLVSGLLLLFFSTVQATPEQVQRVQSVMGTSSTARWANTANTMAPVMLVGAVSILVGMVVLGWRYWAPRQEEEAKLITIVYWGTLGLVVVSSFIALVGGAELTFNLARVGAIVVLLASAAFGAWVYVRLASEGDGSMSLLLVAPAVIMPVTFLIVVASNVPADMIDKMPWGKLFLIAFGMFVLLMLMGGAIAFSLVITLPLQLLGVVERPDTPVDVPGGAGGTGMMVISIFCVLCYLLLLVARWRVMLKPVAWQFVILVVGVVLMASLQNFSFRAQVGAVERQIAKEDQRLTALLQAEGAIPANVTASHERFPGNGDVFVGYDREEVVFLSNGESMSRKGGFHEDYVDPDVQKVPKYVSNFDTKRPTNKPGARPDLATFDPALGRTDPGPVRFIDPDVDTPPDMGRPGGNANDDGPEITIIARNAHLVFHKQDLEYGEVNPDGIKQPGKLASWMPFPNSPKVIKSIGAKPLFTAKGTIVINPEDEHLMAYGLLPDKRPQPVLQMVPQFEPSYMPRGYVGPPRSQRSKDNRDGEPEEGRTWPDFIQPPTVDVRNANPFSFYGYEFDILPDYEVKQIVWDEEDAYWTITIAGKDANDLDHPPLEIYLITSDESHSKDEYDDRPWSWQLDPLNPTNMDAYYEFGLIAGEKFVRLSPDAWRYQSRDARYYYASQMHGMRHRIAMSISSAMQSPAGILECEAMARSLRRQPASKPTPLPGNIAAGRAVKNDARTIAGNAWHINGNFAYPEAIGKTLRPKLDLENTRFLALSWTKEDVGIFIELHDSEGGEDPGPFLIQEQGPEQLPAWTGHQRTVYAYGKEVTYDRLWGDAPFVRINRGPTQLIDGTTHSEVVYYGWLGERWAKVTLRGREDIDISLGELEAYLRLFRLAYPIEVTKGSDYESWVRQFIRDDIPLAGGLTLEDAFDFKKENFRVRDEDAELVFSEKHDPYGGLGPDVFSRTYSPPTDKPDTGVGNKPDEPAGPKVPPGLEPVEGFERWAVDDVVEQYLGSTETFGNFTFKPLKDLRASAKNSERYAEYFARTDSGKVGLSLKFEPLLDDRERIKVPITTDAASGQVTLQLGRRTLRPDKAPDVTYRDTDGLRIWRILMPQAGGSAIRRCYYLVPVQDGQLVIAADYERDKSVQLRAMDASVASLVDNRSK